jgi:hypothetical protein
MKKLLLFVLLALGALSAPANAQQASSAFIVSSCGTLPAGLTYAAGQFGILTMDTTGKLCDSATGGGGGGGAITAASGSYASGALSSGSVASGAMVDLGSQADAACGTATGTCSLIALQKFNNTATGSSVPAGSAIIGKVGIDQTTPGTTNGVAIVGVNGATALAGNGVTGTGSPRVTIASDNSPVAGMGVGATGSPVPANAALQGVSVGGNTTALLGDPCQTASKVYKPISITTATTTNVITGTSAKKIYICQIVLSSAAADNVAVIEGTTGATCGSGTAGIFGGTTAANGFNFSANGGVSIGQGGFSVAQTATNANDICIITSAATPLAGGIMYAVQ